jgi:hypothetical protein
MERFPAMMNRRIAVRAAAWAPPGAAERIAD